MLQIPTICLIFRLMSGFPDGSVVTNLPVVQETQVQSLDQEDPLGKEKATDSSILSWEVS